MADHRRQSLGLEKRAASLRAPDPLPRRHEAEQERAQPQEPLGAHVFVGRHADDDHAVHGAAAEPEVAVVDAQRPRGVEGLVEEGETRHGGHDGDEGDGDGPHGCAGIGF